MKRKKLKLQMRLEGSSTRFDVSKKALNRVKKQLNKYLSIDRIVLKLLLILFSLEIIKSNKKF